DGADSHDLRARAVLADLAVLIAGVAVDDVEGGEPHVEIEAAGDRALVGGCVGLGLVGLGLVGLGLLGRLGVVLRLGGLFGVGLVGLVAGRDAQQQRSEQQSRVACSGGSWMSSPIRSTTPRVSTADRTR